MTHEPHAIVPASPRAYAPKFPCPNCGGYRSHVLRGDARGDQTYRRRRKCDDCAYRFNTTERVENSTDR